jgi:hypothetical protein
MSSQDGAEKPQGDAVGTLASRIGPDLEYVGVLARRLGRALNTGSMSPWDEVPRLGW